MQPEEITKELARITGLVHDFNRLNDKFEIELHINKKENTSYLTLGRIMTLVCDKTKLTPEYLIMKTRETKIVRARQICHYMGIKRSKKKSGEIGMYFGGKDHATVLHSKKTIQDLLDTDKEFRDEWHEFLKTAS